MAKTGEVLSALETIEEALTGIEYIATTINKDIVVFDGAAFNLFAQIRAIEEAMKKVQEALRGG